MSATAGVEGTPVDIGSLVEPATLALIDTGPSTHGWHPREDILRCPRLYAAKRILFALADSGRLAYPEPLVRGSMVHAGLAHRYELRRKGGRRDILQPFDAVVESGRRMRAPEDLVTKAAAALRAYEEEYARERLEVLAVEQEHEAAMELPGGGTAAYSARVDLETVDRFGRITWWDHKTAAKMEQKSHTRYNLAGQILGLQWLGARIHGPRFAGVKINLISVETKPKFWRGAPDPSPAALRFFPRCVELADKRIAGYEGLAPNDYPMVPSELTCMTQYGPCPALSFCQWGSLEYTE